MNAIPPPQPLRANDPLTVEFTMPPRNWNVLIELLTGAPYFLAAPMILAIHEAARAAPLDAAIRQTEGASDSAEPPPPE